MKPPLCALVMGLSLACPLMQAGAPAYPGPDQLPAIKDLPDPLKKADGNLVATPEEWAAQRASIKALLEYYDLGKSPAAPGNVEATELKTQILAEGSVSYKLVHLSFGPNHSLGLNVALFVPTWVKGPVPTIIHLAFTATPGDGAPANPPPHYDPVTPEQFINMRGDALSQGYAILTYFYTQAGADHDKNRDTGFFPAYPDYDWATLAAWAWGVSRSVDYLETLSFVDKDKIILVGHSRLGKATLVAGAFDDRISLVVPAGSGCGGTGAYRINGKARMGKEGIEEMTSKFPYWLSPRMKGFDGKVEKLPFDENFLMALIAPRALLMTDAFDDPYANGKASVASYKATLGTYHFLHADDRIGLHFRPGPHALTDDDWRAILDFANHQLRGTPTEHDFHTIPDSSVLR